MCALTALGTGPPRRVPPPVPVQESNGWEETTILKTGEEASLSVLPQSLQINPQKYSYCHGGKTEDSEDVEEC